MDFEKIRQYILARPDTVEETPILPEIPVFRVGGVMFAYGWPLAAPPRLSLRLPVRHDSAVEAGFPATMSWHRRRAGDWSTIPLDGSVADLQLRAWVDEAYALARELVQKRGGPSPPGESEA